MCSDLDATLERHLEILYEPDVARATAARLQQLVDGFAARPPRWSGGRLDEGDVLLITYPDQVSTPGKTPLSALRDMVRRHLDGMVTAVHLLPLHPSTSDDGFAVADYRVVDPAYGSWDDVEAFRPDLGLMLDAVVNHVSASHPWARGWREGDPDADGYIRTADPSEDLSAVVRPRALPLLTPMETSKGTQHVWTTFSPDQVDLDYGNPDVLVAVTEVLLDYIAHGATLLRLDAVAFLWKEAGTDCIHRPQTHEIIKLWRTIVDAAAPSVHLVTETNVPHRENIAYLGNGDDQAHLVDQFALAPLVLSAFTSGDATPLVDWARSLEKMAEGTAFLNVLGSHDGIGLRPAQGLLSQDEIVRLVDRVRAHGGAVSFRALPDGGVAPYELNCVFYDALSPPDEEEDRALCRFLAAHSIPLAIAGVPALYVHALLGSRNWAQGYKLTGAPRSINRRKFLETDLDADMADDASLRRKVRDGLRARICARQAEPAFHPDAHQHILDSVPQIVAFERTRRDGTARVLCVVNASQDPVRTTFSDLPSGAVGEELCGGPSGRVDDEGGLSLDLDGYEVRWLRFAT